MRQPEGLATPDLARLWVREVADLPPALISSSKIQNLSLASWRVEMILGVRLSSFRKFGVEPSDRWRLVLSLTEEFARCLLLRNIATKLSNMPTC
jgi:hypothetical protein